MSQQLFRSEVLVARRMSWLGGICLAQPLSQWLLALTAFVAALAVALYLAIGTHTRRSTVAGRLVPTQGLATVLAPAAGIVEEMRVTEGARVAAGQTLALIAAPRISIASGPSAIDLERSLHERQASLQSVQQGQQRSLSAQAAGFAAQLTTARGELAQIQAEIGTREQQVRINEETLARMRTLREQRYISQLDLQRQESAGLDQLGTLQELQRQASTLQRNIQQLQQSLEQLPGQQQALAAGMRRDLAALDQERVEMKAYGAVAIAAPVAGVVATQIVKAGQAVQQGQPLLAVLQGDGHLEAELLVPSRAAGFVAPGDRVLLRYQAYPWQKFGHQQGRVTSVSRSALGPQELSALVGSAGEGQPFYRVTVTLQQQAITTYGRAEALKPGMLLDADILGETRRLAEWLFEPLYSLRGKLSAS